MISAVSRVLVACLACFLFPVVELFGATNLITGIVTNNTTWSGTNLVQGTVVVTNGVLVTVEPGTRMLMNTNATLLVYGQLLANGTSNQPITFTRATTAARWNRLLFDRAANSRLSSCVIEYANSVGDHQDYYPTVCNPPTFATRNYHEAVVALACHLDIEGCIFQNLPSSGGEGDAIAIISDHPDPTDTNSWNSASATIRYCRFDGIGQGVHTRYAYVLVEHCYFANKHGDNDDIDLYGESTPPPLIRYNLFLPGHEDKINPTRCSAVIVNNIFIGSDDHGVVLRDKCRPIVMNNIIRDCTNACVAVQNQCEALIVNNTILNSQRGIRFFDHFTRHGPPYCLFPGSGRATILNCTIWDCTSSLELTDSTNGHSYAAVAYCNVEGGQGSASVSANSTLVWGPGNFNIDPQFVSLATNNYHLRTNSPCIDAGTNALLIMTTNWTASVTNDLDGVVRPLDGNGDGSARFDVGAYEFLLANADSNNDGIPDGWTWQYGLDPTHPNVATGNPDGDAYSTLQEWIADTDPTNALSYFHILGISNGPPVTVSFLSSSNRLYTLLCATNLVGNGPGTTWTNVPGQVDIGGTGEVRTLADTNTPAVQKFYRVGVRVP